MNVNILTLKSNDYPSNLAQITTPPAQLFWRGTEPSEWLSRPKVGVVGSRKITPYGKVVTTKLTTELSQAGVVIISGLAYGVDICAHQAALATSGTTVAVLGTSLEDIYPAAHAHIAQQI